MSIARYIFFLIAVVVGVCVISPTLGYERSQAGNSYKDQERDQWVLTNYEAAFHSLLPDGFVAPAKYPGHVSWITVVRISPPNEQLEYRLSLQKTFDGKAEAFVSTPQGFSILKQLRALKRKYPDRDLEQLLPLVSIKHRTFTQNELPQLERLAMEFEIIKMSPVLPVELYVHDTCYEIWSQSRYGNRMQVVLSGPGADAPQQPYPLLRWVEDFRSLVEDHMMR